MTEAWLQLVLGPLGALVLAVSIGVAALRELRRKHAQELQWLTDALRQREQENASLQEKLDTEHAARLKDAHDMTDTLLALNDRIHQTLDRLETLTRRR